MKPKPSIDVNAAGEEAKLLLKEDGDTNATLKEIRSKRVARRERLKTLLTAVWAAFAKKETVNGHATREAWCKEFAQIRTRTAQHIVYGRKANTVRTSFLSRIAAAKKKLAGIQKKIDAYYNAADGTESLDISGLNAQINPIIDPLFEEFLKLITPAGCAVMPIGNHNWHVQAYGQEPVITHIRVSPRKTQCMTRFVNRKFKGMVFAKDGEEVTCPDCIAIRDGKLGGGTLQQARERALVKKQAKEAEAEVGAPIKIQLTDSQMREAACDIAPLSNAKRLTHNARTVTFDAATYQEVGKELILALEQRVESLRAAADKQKKTLLTWTDKSPENVAAFAQQKRLQGGIKACEGAISRIVNGGDDTEDNLYDWYEQHRDERLGISAPAQALAAATEAAADMPSNIAPEILETIKHQKARIALGLHPTNDECPNEDDEDEEEFEDETEENSEEEVL